jgi:branched-chain amino acid transport system substrate-binding protein
MRSSAAIAVLVAALVGLGCGGSERPLRIGVVVDCEGVNRPLQAAELAGAELPLLQRGAKLRGRDAVDGITDARIAGRRVEVVQGCTELFEFSALTAEIRRLVEHEHVDVVVAGGSGPDELAVRDVAALYPDVIFMPVVHGPREVTTRERQANVFRVEGDHEQGVAGLATYAYRTLGWRRAVVAFGAWDSGWGERDAFVAEFCSLGGRVTSQLSTYPSGLSGRDAARVPRDVDGVAVFIQGVYGPSDFLEGLARHERDPRRIVVGPTVVDEPDLLRSVARPLDGVVGSSFLPAASAPMNAYLRAMGPGVPSPVARSDVVLGYRNAVEVVARALEGAKGDPARLPAQLAVVHTELPGGPQRLDTRHQAVVATSIVRIGAPAARSAAPTLAPVATTPGVDQSVGGLLAPSLVPGSQGATCRRTTPPPWAR